MIGPALKKRRSKNIAEEDLTKQRTGETQRQFKKKKWIDVLPRYSVNFLIASTVNMFGCPHRAVPFSGEVKI